MSQPPGNAKSLFLLVAKEGEKEIFKHFELHVALAKYN